MDARQRLAVIVDTMREMSRQTDPQVIAKIYGQRMRQLMPMDRFVSLSRRELDRPRYRITRSSLWKEEVNPWKERERLPLLSGGLLAELIWGDEPRIIDDLSAVFAADDPAHDYLAGMGSLVGHPALRPGRGPEHGRRSCGSEPDGVRLRRTAGDGVDEQPLRPGDAQPGAGRAGQGGVRGSRPGDEDGRRPAAVAAARPAAEDSDDGAGRPLPDVAPGRRRLLRLLPAARAAAGAS